jgi:hypothetical protein
MRDRVPRWADWPRRQAGRKVHFFRDTCRSAAEPERWPRREDGATSQHGKSNAETSDQGRSAERRHDKRQFGSSFDILIHIPTTRIGPFRSQSKKGLCANWVEREKAIISISSLYFTGACCSAGIATVQTR